MEKTPIHKKVAALAIALVLSVGAAGGVGYSTAHAESGSSHSSISGMSEESLIAMLQDLIKLLETRLQALIDARGTVANTGNNDHACATTTATGLTELEAKVFTNETIVKIELDGVKQVLTTDATTRSDIADAILTQFTDLTDSEVNDALVIEHENRTSKASDKTLTSFGSHTSASCETLNHDQNDDNGNDQNDNEDEGDDDSGPHGGNSGHGGGDD